MTNLDPLRDVRIAAPCTSSWAAMAGDERVRHCTLCSLNVYNFAAMSADEVRSLLLQTEGRLCARIYRRRDGTMITRDCPTGLRALRRRVSRAAGAVLAALLAFTGCATARGNRSALKIDSLESTVTNAMLIGSVTIAGDPLPGVTVALRNEATGRNTTVVTNADGEFSIVTLEPGLYAVEVELIGFTSASKQHVVVDANRVTQIRATLETVELESITVGGIAPILNPSTSEQTTVISGDLLQTLKP